MKNRCEWVANNKYENMITYHDNEWCEKSYDDGYLFEMLVLESFHCGLSWQIVLNKRENFRKAFSNFEPSLIANYDDEKIRQLLRDESIIRSKGKIKATIKNAQAFLIVQKEFGSFSNFLWSFNENKVLFNGERREIVKNDLSIRLSKLLKKKRFFLPWCSHDVFILASNRCHKQSYTSLFQTQK